MEVGARKILQDDRTSDCRSFGSNFYLSSQSRKISIGVMLDSLAKKTTATTKEDKIPVLTTDKATNGVESSIEEKNNWKGGAAAVRRKETEAPDQVSSPWTSMRAVYQETSPETVLRAKQASDFPSSDMHQSMLIRLKDAPVACSAQVFANQTSLLQSKNGNQKKFKGINYKRRGEKNGNSERVEEFTFATKEEVLVLNKETTEEKIDKAENGGTETLKMKLWEILGTISSPKSQHCNSQPREGTCNSKSELIVDQVGDRAVKPRHNSDTIETDSESPSHTISRPVTRSFSRKRAPTKLKPKKAKMGQSPDCRPKLRENKIFSFKKGRSQKLGGLINCESPQKMTARRNSSATEPRNICFPEKDKADKIEQATCGLRAPSPTNETSSGRNRVGETFGFPANGQSFKPINEVQETDGQQSPITHKINQLFDFHSPELPDNLDQLEDFRNSSLNNDSKPKDDFQNPTFGFEKDLQTLPNVSVEQKEDSQPLPMTRKRNQQVDCDSAALPDNAEEQEHFSNSSLKNVTNLQDDFQSPTFGFRTPILSFSPRSTPTSVQMEQAVSSPAVTERIVGNIRSFWNLQSSKSDHYDSDHRDDEEKLKHSSLQKPRVVKEKKAAEDDCSESTSEESDSECPEERSPTVKGYDSCRERETSKGKGAVEKPKFMTRSGRFCYSEDIRVDESSPTLVSQKGIGESDRFQETSEQSQEDELARAVTLFALALESFKRKMQSVTRQKSSEILTSVSKKIQLQLQNVESQIQFDVGKLAGLSKSKRKLLETRFEEHQVKLNHIHEKFKEEIHRHLQDCKSTLEGLDANQIELKGTLKKQKASHKKLLLQAEEAVEAQLNDAQKRVMIVHELAQDKMLQLKNAIADCLEEGILG